MIQIIFRHLHRPLIKHVQSITGNLKRSTGAIGIPADIRKIRNPDEPLRAEYDHLPPDPQVETRVRGDRENEVAKSLIQISLINITRPRTAIAALLGGADSLGEEPKIRSQVQVRIQHRPDQIVS